jgi:hypothetical protein
MYCLAVQENGLMPSDTVFKGITKHDQVNQRHVGARIVRFKCTAARCPGQVRLNQRNPFPDQLRLHLCCCMVCRRKNRRDLRNKTGK